MEINAVKMWNKSKSNSKIYIIDLLIFLSTQLIAYLRPVIGRLRTLWRGRQKQIAVDAWMSLICQQWATGWVIGLCATVGVNLHVAWHTRIKRIRLKLRFLRKTALNRSFAFIAWKTIGFWNVSMEKNRKYQLD